MYTSVEEIEFENNLDFKDEFINKYHNIIIDIFNKNHQKYINNIVAMQQIDPKGNINNDIVAMQQIDPSGHINSFEDCLSSYILFLLENPDKRISMAKQARTLIEDHFSWEAIYKQMDDVLLQCGISL